MMVHENTRFTTPVRGRGDVPAPSAPHLGPGVVPQCHDIYGKQPYLAKEENFIILDLGVHMLDVARFLLGDVAQLYCQS